MSRVGEAWQLEIDAAGFLSYAVYAIVEENEEGCYGVIVVAPDGCQHLLGVRVLLPHEWFVREEATRLG